MEAPTSPKSGEVLGYLHLPNLSYILVLGVSMYVGLGYQRMWQQTWVPFRISNRMIW